MSQRMLVASERAGPKRPARRPIAGVARWFAQAIPFHYAALLPALLATLAVIIVPLLFSFGVSFYHYVLTEPRNIYFDGFVNFARAFRDPTFADSLRTTVIYGVGSVTVELVLGMLFALVVQGLTRGQGILRTAMLVPMFITPAVVAFMWRFILHGDLGIMNYLLRSVGLPGPVWLGTPILALVSVMLVDIWRNTPFMFLVYLAGMQSLPTELYEAAAVDGATPWQQFLRVTLPMLKPLILVSLIIRGMDALREFDTIFIMTGGGPGNATETIALATYRYSFRNYDMGLGSAVSYVIFGVVFLLSLVFVRQMQKSRAD
jgi:multiple sugar transport system permease protein